MLKKFVVEIKSKAGMSLPFHSMIVVDAKDEKDAKNKALDKAKRSKPVYKFRNRSCWVFLQCKEVPKKEE